jgi:hypothetical protein
MDKDQILQMSRDENKGQPDEREQSIEKQAANIAKAVGIAVCLLLVLLAECVLHNRDIGRTAWIVFFAMEGSSNCCKFIKTKKRSYLFWAVLELICAVIYLTFIILLTVL